MLAARIVMGTVLTLAGFALVWVARAGADGRLQRNPLVGIRTARTLSSDRAWMAAHQAGATATEAGGWCAVVTGALAFIPGPVEATFVIGAAGALLMVALAAAGGVKGVRAAREIH